MDTYKHHHKGDGLGYSPVKNNEPPSSTTGTVKFTYVGETSRPFRARVAEHYRKARLLKPQSFMVQHWAKHHYTSDTQPEFKFKVVRTCSEAVWINEMGNLNSKSEFGLNHLCRLVSETPQ